MRLTLPNALRQPFSNRRYMKGRQIQDMLQTQTSEDTISGVNLTGPDFLGRKEKIIAALDHEIKHGNLDRMAAIRRNKQTL